MSPRPSRPNLNPSSSPSPSRPNLNPSPNSPSSSSSDRSTTRPKRHNLIPTSLRPRSPRHRSSNSISNISSNSSTNNNTR